MGNNLLLVGSVPLESVEEVMRTFGGALARHLPFRMARSASAGHG
jgi:hypothetical protein